MHRRAGSVQDDGEIEVAAMDDTEDDFSSEEESEDSEERPARRSGAGGRSTGRAGGSRRGGRAAAAPAAAPRVQRSRGKRKKALSSEGVPSLVVEHTTSLSGAVQRAPLWCACASAAHARAHPDNCFPIQMTSRWPRTATRSKRSHRRAPRPTPPRRRGPAGQRAPLPASDRPRSWRSTRSRTPPHRRRRHHPARRPRKHRRRGKR